MQKEPKFYGYENYNEGKNVVLDQNYKVKFKVEDQQGNYAEREIIITNIDKELPTLELSKNEDEEVSSLITINANDSLSGISNVEINGIKLTSTNGVCTYRATENGIYTVTAIDKAGNSVTKEIEVTNIKGNESAAIVFEKNGGLFTLNANNKVNIEEKVTVGNIAISKIEYVWATSEEIEDVEYIQGGNTTALNLTKEFIAEGEYYLHIRVTDESGNITTATSNVYKIEKLPIVLDSALELKEFEEEQYIILSKETDATELLSQITENEGYTVEIKNDDLSQEVSGNEKVKTGDNVVVESEYGEITYKIITKGDINGDGKIDLSDLFKLNKYRQRKIQLTEAEWIAGDVNGDKTINISDLFAINKYRLKKITKL